MKGVWGKSPKNHMKRSIQRRVVASCMEKGMTVASAESCTGGLIAKLITDVPGSSAVLAGACVTYTNAVKMKLLGVSPELIERYTEVSEPCARAMAEGTRALFGTDVAVSTTGYAGPGGGTEQDPVGTVYIAVASKNGTRCERLAMPQGSTRAATRSAAATRALEMVLEV